MTQNTIKEIEDMDDIESYLSVFKRKEAGKSQIDWAKLMESPSQDVGEGIMLDFEGATEMSTFLKPKPAQGFSRDRGTGSGEVVGGDNSLQNVGGRQKHPQLAMKTHHHLRARGAQSLETSSISAEAFDTSSLTEVGTEHSGALELDQLSGSDLESDGGRNPLANIKIAEDFFLTGDENGKRSVQLDRKRSSTDMKGTKPKVAQSDNEETESESEQFQLTRNVFSIDQLKAVASDEEDEEINSDESCAGEDIKTDGSSIRFRNVHTLNDLNVHTDRTTEPTASFRSGQTGSGTSAEERNLKIKPAVVKVYPGNQAVKDEPSCAGSYSDEEFESISESSNGNIVEEEDIVEELSETETQMNVKSESDVENSQDTNTEDSTHYEENPSEKGRHLPGSGGRRLEDYSEHISENTAQKSHTPNEHGLSSSPCRTSIVNQDHSDYVSTLNSKEQSSCAHDSVQPPLAAQEQPTLHELLYGREYLDPPPVAPHVISATTLEAMAVHTPAIAALNKLLLSQIALTQQFLATSRRATEQLSSSIESGYQYTTLEETKEYIAKHRPKVLKPKEARKLVEMEEHRRC